MPRVTVVLTCYNHLRHLRIAFDCIKAQTFQDFEVVAIDDGSTDGTREWLTEQLAFEPRLRLELNEKNIGTYATLNKGVALAQGEYIAEFNDDDVWDATKLEKQVAVLDSQFDVGLVHTSGWFIDDDGGRLEKNPLGFDWPRTGQDDPLFELAYYNRIIASSVLVRKSCFEKVGGFSTDYFGSGDWEMWYRIAEEYKITYIDEPLTLYRVHAGSASHHRDRIAMDDHRVRQWMIGRLQRYAEARWGKDKAKRVIAHQWACIGTARMNTGDRAGARDAYRHSLQVMPGRLKSVVRYASTYLPKGLARLLDA